MRYGYTALARELNQRFEISPPLKPQHVDMWNKRRTRNKAGQMFPSPAVRHDKAMALGCKPRFEWDLEPVLAWVRGGIPGPPHTWRYPREYIST